MLSSPCASAVAWAPPACSKSFTNNHSQETPMDLSLSKDELAFRDEVRTFFKDNVPETMKQKLREGRHTSKQDLVDWTRILHKKGWAVAHWPKEHGGTGWTPVQQYIFNEE